VNAECPASLLEEVARPDAAGEKLLRDAAARFGLSARGYHRTLRLARTLADLAGEDNILPPHIAEALSCRGEGMLDGGPRLSGTEFALSCGLCDGVRPQI
jgi:predicted ATPase with chaperone activity